MSKIGKNTLLKITLTKTIKKELEKRVQIGQNAGTQKSHSFFSFIDQAEVQWVGMLNLRRT